MLTSWLFILAIAAELAALTAFVRWARRAPQPMRRLYWSLLALTATTCAGLLIWRLNLPDEVWSKMVHTDPRLLDQRSDGLSSRSFSPLFWTLSWVLYFPPFLALKDQMEDRTPLNRQGLRRFRLTLGYTTFQFLGIGLILI